MTFVRWEHVGYFQVNGECMRPARPGGKSKCFHGTRGLAQGIAGGQTASGLPDIQSFSVLSEGGERPLESLRREGA